MDLTCRLMKALATYKSCVYKEMRLFGGAYQFGHIFIYFSNSEDKNTDHTVDMTLFLTGF